MGFHGRGRGIGGGGFLVRLAMRRLVQINRFIAFQLGLLVSEL
jgi:hypothetical protein